jgi:ectoine hydroxylase-related dioxygenase (phytanoyl-CoA dioxygenase family)
MPVMLSKQDIESLDRNGYAILETAVDASFLRALRTRIEELFEQEGENAGAEFRQEAGSRRLANLVNKGDVFREAIQHTAVLAANAHMMGEFKLSSLNVRSAEPGDLSQQPLHCDMAALKDARGFWVANTVWMIDDFTLQNGPLRVVPGSHLWMRLPQQDMADIHAAHPQEEVVTGKAGTLVIMNAHTWHGGTANRSNGSRIAMHAFYCRNDKPQQQYQKQLLDQSLQQSLSAALRQLLALDDLENDRLSSDPHAVRSGFLKA